MHEGSALRNVGERQPPQQTLGEDLLGKGSAFLFITVVSVTVGVLFSLLWHSCHPNGPMSAADLKKELQANGLISAGEMGAMKGGPLDAGAGGGGETRSEASQAAAPSDNGEKSKK
mmetsp:Transcript_4921/g.12281  ORF Transcript_4921/g.12281 Transcript_4921/m.12281 type:complete len:116 (-) Transcript_4921:302-649(-)|eukprot:CAMPEP_0178998818 /NCGR_PEP_ID=MMETSP0795-20121207/9712_1 /TAXON_ID=88552 /ORGANISM="Amoebophrya sp., Strain Ameob2" /LENGTH=115 /DNA_ID=CAMNT_0020691515 /DNA_START=91 /DNA_END=438 /DNA_ORIENTATION=+